MQIHKGLSSFPVSPEMSEFKLIRTFLKCSLLQWVCKNTHNQVLLQSAYRLSGRLDGTALSKSLTKIMNSFNLFTGNFCNTIFHSFSNGVLTWPWISVMVRNLFWFWMIEHIILLTSLHCAKLLSSSSSLICSIRWGNLRHISSMMYVINKICITKLQVNSEQASKEKEVFLQKCKHCSVTRGWCNNVPENAKIKLTNVVILQYTLCYFWPSRSFVQICKDPFLFNNWDANWVALLVELCKVAGTGQRKLE